MKLLLFWNQKIIPSILKLPRDGIFVFNGVMDPQAGILRVKLRIPFLCNRLNKQNDMISKINWRSLGGSSKRFAGRNIC